MKRKILLTVMMAIAMCLALVVVASAATYYVDKDGNLVDSTSESIAYEYELSKNSIPNIYLHDSTVTKIVIPDMPDYTGTVQLQSGYAASLGIFTIEDKETKENNLKTQITEVEIHENIYLDGAYSDGTFSGYTGLEKISFYGKVSAASKAGFFQNCVSIMEIHFYGKDLAIPSSMLGSDLSEGNIYNSPIKIVFHEGATGTISTGADTLPTVGKLGGWKIIINPNITPSNPNDTRLGAKWGGITSTTGWELIVACNPSLYTAEQLEALKTSHGFCSRAASVDAATVKEATVMSYCDALYDGAHNEKDDHNCETANGCERCGKIITEAAEHVFEQSIVYENGFTANGDLLTDCTNAGCTACDGKTTVNPIFVAKG